MKYPAAHFRRLFPRRFTVSLRLPSESCFIGSPTLFLELRSLPIAH